MQHVLWKSTLVCGMIAGPALADGTLAMNGDPFEGDSWTQTWTMTNWGAVDLLGVDMLSAGDTFEATVISNFSVGGWSMFGDYGPTPTVAAATGPGFNDTTADFKMAGLLSNALEYDVYFYTGNVLTGRYNVVWDGTQYTTIQFHADGSRSRDDFETAVIPLPTGAAMAGLGLCGLAIRRRR